MEHSLLHIIVLFKSMLLPSIFKVACSSLQQLCTSSYSIVTLFVVNRLTWSVTCAADIATSVFIHPLICLFHLFRYFANFIDNKQFKKEEELLWWVLWRTLEMDRDSSPGLIWKLPGWPGLEVRHKLSVLALCFAAPRPCYSLFLDRSGAILTSVLVRPSIGLNCHFIHFL